MRFALGLGSNLGNREGYLKLAADGLRELGPVVVSSHHETEPVGPPQPRYLNAAAVVESDLAPEAMHAYCKQLEARAERVRVDGDKWGPRTLDVDLLLCDDIRIDTPTLRIPHDGLAERMFVLAPLVEIAPGWVVPGDGRTIEELYEACRVGR
jgi:2-amino-4-hydroxy-6-hydroxymethyldihydropteridine diphosphokinase